MSKLSVSVRDSQMVDFRATFEKLGRITLDASTSTPMSVFLGKFHCLGWVATIDGKAYQDHTRVFYVRARVN